MSILLLLSEAEYPLGVNAIARELSLAPSSCFKILKALLNENFVEFDTRTKGYSLGVGAIRIARRALDPSRALDMVQSRLEQLARMHAIAIGLWRVTHNDRMVLIGFAEGASQLRIHMSVGQRVPMLIGAVGRAIAARLALSPETLRQGFDALRWQKPLSFEEYLDQVEHARQVGYGLDEGYFAPGVSTVAVPIADEAGAIRYGISGIMFSGQHDRRAMDAIAQELKEVAEWASARLLDRSARQARASA